MLYVLIYFVIGLAIMCIVCSHDHVIREMQRYHPVGVVLGLLICAAVWPIVLLRWLTDWTRSR